MNRGFCSCKPLMVYILNWTPIFKIEKWSLFDLLKCWTCKALKRVMCIVSQCLWMWCWTSIRWAACAHCREVCIADAQPCISESLEDWKVLLATEPSPFLSALHVLVTWGWGVGVGSCLSSRIGGGRECRRGSCHWRPSWQRMPCHLVLKQREKLFLGRYFCFLLYGRSCDSSWPCHHPRVLVGH